MTGMTRRDVLGKLGLLFSLPLFVYSISSWLRRTANRIFRRQQMPPMSWLGFKSSTTIEPGQRAYVNNVVPYGDFAARKLIIPSTLNQHFDIFDIDIDGVSQLSCSEPIPAAAFDPIALVSDVRFDYGRHIRVGVVNTSNEPRIFRAAMSGFWRS